MICPKFSEQEDDFIRRYFRKLKISRLAHKLGRTYEAVECRCVVLGLLSEKSINHSKFCTDDEIEYNLLQEGCTEEEIKKLRGSKSVVFCFQLFKSKNYRSIHMEE